jgi:hypothetical protein
MDRYQHVIGMYYSIKLTYVRQLCQHLIDMYQHVFGGYDSIKLTVICLYLAGRTVVTD